MILNSNKESYKIKTLNRKRKVKTNLILISIWILTKIQMKISFLYKKWKKRSNNSPMCSLNQLLRKNVIDDFEIKN